MLDTQDITALREMLLEQEGRFLAAMKENDEDIKRELRRELKADIENSANNLRKEIIHEVSGAIKQNAKDTQREIREEMQALLIATENRIKKDLGQEMGEMKKEIILGVGEFVSTAILPQLDELYRDVTRIKKHLKMA